MITSQDAKDMCRNIDEWDVVDAIYDDFEKMLKDKQEYGNDCIVKYSDVTEDNQYWQGYANACGELLEGINNGK